MKQFKPINIIKRFLEFIPQASLRAICIFLFVTPVRSEIIFSSPPVVAPELITHSTANFRWTNPPGVLTNKQVAYDTTAYFQTNGQFRYKTVWDGAKSFSDTISIGLSGLQANTSYTACVLVSSNADSTDCTNVGNANSRVVFTTSPLPLQHPQPPQLPSSWDSSYPPSFGAILAVTPNCSDINTILASAYGPAYTGQNVKIIVPSDRHVTGGAGTCTNIAWPSIKTGGGKVVLATDDEALLPPEGVRISMDFVQAGYLVTLRAPAPDQVVTSISGSASNLRLVGFRFAPAIQNGESRVQTYLVRYDGGVNGLIVDRSVFDCIGYPYRVQHTFYGKGSNIAALSSYWNNCYIWKGWVSKDFEDTNPNPAILSTKSFYIGRGDRVDAVGAFTITLNGASGSGNGVLYEESGGQVTFKYSAGSPISSCTGITCVLDATLTIPSGALPLSRGALTYSSGKFGLGTLTPSFFSHSPIDQIPMADGALVESEWESNGPELDGGPGGEIQNVKFENNYFGVTGFGIFSNGGGIQIHDIVIRRNDFQNHAAAFLGQSPSLLSNPYTATRRQDVEFKNGYRVLIEGNRFRDGWISVGGNTAAAIALKRDLVVNPPNARTGDFTIRDNSFEREPACIYIAGDSGNGSIANYTYLIKNVSITNNVCQTDGARRALWGIPQYTITTGGFFLWYEQMQEDLIIRHNTVLQFGSTPAMLLRNDQCGDGLVMTDNIFMLHNSASLVYRGIAAGPSSWSQSTPSCTVSSGQDGSAALAANYPSNGGALVKGNVIIAGCKDASACTESSSGTELLDSLADQYPPENTWISSPSNLKGRLDAVGWTSRTEGNLSLSPSSAYNATHGISTDGKDPGIDWVESQRSQGAITNINVLSTGSTSATISFTAPDPGKACYVSYGTDGDIPSYTRTGPSFTNSTARSITLSSLNAETTYKYLVMCDSASEQPVGTFKTATTEPSPPQNLRRTSNSLQISESSSTQ